MPNSPLTSVLHRLRYLVGPPQEAADSDAALLRRFVQQHDEAAFGILLRRHGPLVHGVCRQVLRDRHAADDVFQATFLVLAKKAAAIRQHDSLAAWLHRVAANLARTARTSALRRHTHERQAMAQAPFPPRDEASRPDWQPLLHEEVDRLPQKYRVPVVLCYLQGKTHEQAADHLGWPIGTVKGRLGRARDLLRRRLVRRGLTLPAATVAVLLAKSAATAAVPPAVERTTLHAVHAALTGSLLAGGLTTPAATLAQGMMTTMMMNKVKHIAVICLLSGLLATGAGVAGYHVLTLPVPAGADQQVFAAAVPLEPAPPPVEDAKKAALRAKLDQAVNLDKGIDPNTPLKDALEFLGQKYDVNLVLDTKAFEAVGAQKVDEQGVQMPRMVGIRLSTVLRLLMAQLSAPEYTVRYRVHADRVEITPAMDDALETGARLRPPAVPTEAGKGRGTLEAALTQLIDLNKGIDGNTPLKDALEYLSDKYGLTIVIDTKGFEPFGIQKIEEQPVQLAPMTKVKLITVLHKLMQCIKVADDAAVGYCLGDMTLAGGGPALCLTALPRSRHQPAYSPDGKLLATVSDHGGSVRLWDLAGHRVRHELKRAGEEIGDCVFTPDSQHVLVASSTGADCAVRRWDVIKGKETQLWQRMDISPLAFAPAGRTLAALDAGSLVLVDGATGKERCRAEGDPKAITTLHFSADGRLLVAGISDLKGPPTVCLWDAATGRRVVRLTLDETAGGDGLPVHGLTLSPDGKVLAALNMLNQVSLWEVASGRRLTHLQVAGACAVTFAPNGKVLAISHGGGGRPELSLWEVYTGQELGRCRGERYAMGTGAFAPDGKTLAAECEGSTAVLWDVAELSRAAPPPAPFSSRELDALWGDLASDNALQGRRAVVRLAAAPEQAVPFLQARLRPTTPQDMKRVTQLIADLDSASFETRERAGKDLIAIGKLAEPALRRVLQSKPSLEVRQRIEALLPKFDGPVRAPEQLRSLRGIDALEQAGTARAHTLLQSLAKGEADSPTTHAAQAALNRLAMPAK